MPAGETPWIELKGVSTNNLKALDARFPLGQITVVTGMSGSGKSSLVFDTLYGEAYRRYVESLSSFARQYLKALPKPELAGVVNLPPAVAVRQQQSTANSRSTVGTATELVDHLRLLFSHLGEVHCLKCGTLVRREIPEVLARQILDERSGQKLLITAPLDRWGKITAKDLKVQLEGQGFTRLLTADGTIGKLETLKAAELKGAAVIIDRITAQADSATRLTEALQLAFRVGRGKLIAMPLAGEKGAVALGQAFSTGLDCATCGSEYQEPSMALLSFNHPLGACPTCQGFGFAADLDWDKIVPDRTKTLTEQAISPWNFGKFAEYYQWAASSAKRNHIDLKKPLSAFTTSEWEWLRRGEGREFDGVLGFFEYLESKKYKAHYRIHAARYRRFILCPTCQGDRLKPIALAVRLCGLNLAEASRLRIEELAEWMQKLPTHLGTNPAAHDPQDPRDQGLMGVGEALVEAGARLSYLRQIGVGYLSLDRPARTLSGGELQRINMARCLGSALTETLFCLDEPSAGLHARDSANLMGVISQLRDQGNTVVMVEHEARLIAAADHLLEIGPRAGREGGHLVYAGPPQLSPVKHLSFQEVAAAGMRTAASPDLKPGHVLTLSGANLHNLKDVTVHIPTGAITAVCGVSGSGKTSLVQHTFYPLAAKIVGQAAERAYGQGEVLGTLTPEKLVKAHSEVLLVSQAGLGRSSRSTIATYLGIMDEIRKLLAATPMAEKLGFAAGTFSFNNSKERGGGRCDTCQGLGTVLEDLSFLGEMAVVCPACNGQRFEPPVLTVELRGRNLNQILKLTVAEAREFFFDRPVVTKVCDVVIGMGMGYLTLGQETSSFSGGEAQRLKLLSLLREVKVGKPALLIFDEPTTGLSDRDVAGLLGQLRALADRGHTLVIIEHHLAVLAAADWLIEIGPEAAEKGGQLVYEGPPAGLSAIAQSVTRPYLAATPALGTGPAAVSASGHRPAAASSGRAKAASSVQAQKGHR